MAILPDVHFTCEPPIDASMIAPLDVEAVGPDSPLVQGGPLIYLTHAPVEMDLAAGVRINCPSPGLGTISVAVYADGVKIFSLDQVLSTQTHLASKALVKPQYRIIPAATRLDCRVEVISQPGAYPGWKGLRVAFLPVAVPTPP